MDNVKKVLVAAGAVMALGAQAQTGPQYPEEPAGAAAGYSQFTSDLGVFCGAVQPFTAAGDPAWTCSGGVDQGITAGPRPAPTGTAPA